MSDPIVITLRPDASSVVLARTVVGERVRSLPDELADDAVLLASELVSNAVRHGVPAITLSVAADSDGISVHVADLGPSLPELPAAAPPVGQASGRGLRLVDALASSWGITANDPPPGKTVWFTLHR